MFITPGDTLTGWSLFDSRLQKPTLFEKFKHPISPDFRSKKNPLVDLASAEKMSLTIREE